LTAFASIGDTGGITGSRITPLSPRRGGAVFIRRF
jgi:hypothetical protein